MVSGYILIPLVLWFTIVSEQPEASNNLCRRTDCRGVYPLGASPHSSFINLNRIHLPCLVGCLEEYNNTLGAAWIAIQAAADDQAGAPLYTTTNQERKHQPRNQGQHQVDDDSRLSVARG